MKHNVPIQSLIDHIKTATDVDPWAKEMAEELLKEQETDAMIMLRCREGSTVKYIGRGVVVLNYQWWIDTLKRRGEFSPVPTQEDMR